MSSNASQLSEFKVGAQINLYYPPCLVFFGTIGNILSFLVYKDKKHRNRSSTYLILALSILDSLMLLVGLLQYWILFNFEPRVLTEAHCKGMFFVVNFFGNYSHWIIVCFSIDRFIAIRYPMKGLQLLTVSKGLMCIAIIGAVAFIKNFHYLWTTDFFLNPESGIAICAFGLKNKAPWVAKYQVFEVTISSFVPFIMILLCNILIIVKIKQRSKVQPGDLTANQNESNEACKKKRKTERALTRILFLVSTMFIITTCPLLIFRLYYARFDISQSSPQTQANYNLGHHICHKLWYTNNGINFLLYCWSSKSFRKDLMSLWKQNSRLAGETSMMSTTKETVN
eukprot:TCONS_00059765-protein